MFKYLVLLVIPFSVMASDPHHDHDHDGGGTTTNTTQITNIYNTTSVAIAGAVAHAAKCDSTTFSLQGSVGLSNYKGTNAAAFGLCQRYDDLTAGLSIAHQEGDKDPMVSVGIHWRFP